MVVANVTTILTNLTAVGLQAVFGGMEIVGAGITIFLLISMIRFGFDRGAIMFFAVLITGSLASMGYLPAWVFLTVLAVISIFIIKAYISLTGE